jgi:hypothetical protein
MVVFPSIEFEGAENQQGTRTTLDWNDLDMAMAKSLEKEDILTLFSMAYR